MDPTIPLFDWHSPWVALIQFALLFVLPKVTQKIVSLWATGIAKTATLAVLSVIGSGLTWLLDIAVADAWATADWTALVNVLFNAGVTWAIGSRFFENVIAKSPNYEKAATSGLNLFENTAKAAAAVAAAKASTPKATAKPAARSAANGAKR